MNEERRRQRTRRLLNLSVYLGIIGSVWTFFLAIYILSIFQEFSSIISNQEIATFVYSLSTLTIICAILQIYGSVIVLRSKWEGGALNIIANIIPLLTYMYFTFISEPKLIHPNLIPIGLTLSFFPLLSGIISILVNKIKQ